MKVWAAALILLAAVGCSVDSSGLGRTERRDAGPADTGPGEMDAGPDSGPGRDTGPELDAGADATPVDAGADASIADAGVDAGPIDAGPDAGSFDAGPGGCSITFFTAEMPTGRHVETCSPVAYDTIPPHSGPHYGSWADFEVYAAPVPWGFLVHSMEHGGIVIAYNCPSGCPVIVSALEGFVADYPADPLCTAPLRHRLILVPDPTLDVPIAAAAWGHTYRATCLDLRTLRLFVDSVYGTAPENFCAAGVDLSDVGWCPVAT